MSEKECNTCKITKSLDEYSNNPKYRYGKENRCKECNNQRNRDNRDKLREYQKKWRDKNPDYMKNYENNPNIIAYRKQYYKDHSQLYKDRKTQWRKDNPEREAETRRKYNEENRYNLNEYHRKWKQNIRNIDVNYKIKENTSRRIRYELNTLLKGKKTKRTTEYIGCTIEELKVHIEQQFKNGMNWENYGSYWHIDHIIPCSAWNLSIEEDNMLCWNFRNLQPLESSLNQSKKDFYEEETKNRYIDKMKSVFESLKNII